MKIIKRSKLGVKLLALVFILCSANSHAFIRDGIDDPTVVMPPQAFLHQGEVDDYYIPPYQATPFGHYSYGPSNWGTHCAMVWSRTCCTPINVCRWRNQFPYCQQRWVCTGRPAYVRRCWTGY